MSTNTTNGENEVSKLSEIFPFRQIESSQDIVNLLGILENRIPHSSNVSYSLQIWIMGTKYTV